MQELLDRILNFLDLHLDPVHARTLFIAWVISIPVLIVDTVSKVMRKARSALHDMETSKATLLKLAQRNEKKGNLDTAAQAYLRADETDLAMDCFRRCGHPERAADVAMNLGLFATAARDFETAELKESAAVAWAKGNEFSRAEEIYAGLGNVLSIAKMYEDAEDYDAATDYYKQLNMNHKVIELLEMQGHYADAAQVLAESIRMGMATMGGYSRPELPDNGEQEPDMERTLSPIEHALKLFSLAKAPADAARFLEDIGYQTQAAEHWEQAGEYRQAAELYETAEDLQAAARAWEQAGVPERRAANLAEASRNAGQIEEAARHFMDANQPARAAEMLERAGQSKEAAAAFEKSGSLVRAAVLYRDAGFLVDAARCLEGSEQPTEAAACYRELGNHQKAAELLLQIGKAMEAGNALLDAGDRDAAMRAFQQVKDSHPQYHRACRQIGMALLEQGHTDLAVRKLEEGLTGSVTEADTLDGYYALGHANHGLGNIEAAISAFEVILGRDLEFRDTLARCQQLRAQVEAAKQAVAQPAVPPNAEENVAFSDEAISTTAPPEPLADLDDNESPFIDDARMANPKDDQ